ncbi:MAG TPA: hypothetical protein VNC61_01605 [Acidimicrobiales bacterium]|nr:hypothetical protein [Acidimicrobiales bacterium]
MSVPYREGDALVAVPSGVVTERGRLVAHFGTRQTMDADPGR